MFKTTKVRIVGLVLAGAVVLSGGIYATTALAAGGPSTETTPSQAVSTTAEWREGMLDMLQDHMGLSGQAAEDFADEMTEHMQGFDNDFNFQEMTDWCNQYGGPDGEGAYGPGMMDEGTYGPGMMDDYGTCGPGMMGDGTYDPGMMDDDSAYGGYGYGMMGGMMDGYYSLDQGWHMMDTAPLPQAGSTGQATTAPTTPRPQQSGNEPGYRSTPGAMMGTTTGNGTGATQENWGMMDEAGNPSVDSVPMNQTRTTATSPTPTPTTTPATQGGGFGANSYGMMGSGMMGR
jgi:hypothetical protein